VLTWLFGAMVWKLLIIEPFFQGKLNKIQIQNYIGIWRKAFGESNLIKFISQFQNKGVEDIDFWVEFVIGNSNKLQKLVLERKISWALNVFTLPNFKKFNFKDVKNKECVHTKANGTCYNSSTLISLESFKCFH
jgi:hypothetical protein